MTVTEWGLRLLAVYWQRIGDKEKSLKPFNSVQKSELSLIWKYYLQNVLTKHIFDWYVLREFGIK